MSKVGYKYLVENHGDEIKKMYLEDKMTLKEIGEIYGGSYNLISRTLREMNVSIRSKSEAVTLTMKNCPTNILAEKHGEEIVELYLQKEHTLKEIGKIYNVEYYIVGRALEFLGVTLRNHSQVSILNNKNYDSMGRTYDLNKDYFKTWSTDMSYILGFIASDGNVHKKDRVVEGKIKETNSLNIGLSIVDVEQLKSIKNKLGYTGIIREFDAKIKDKEYPSCSLNITSKEMVNDLIRLGIEPNKSLKIKFPSIPEEYELDFIRGYFDGNGSIGLQYPSGSITAQIRTRIFSGSEHLAFGIQEILQKHGLKFKNVNKAKGKEVYEICYSTKESLLLYDLFYKDEDCMKLKRKYDKFKEIIQIRNKDIENNNTKTKVGN